MLERSHLLRTGTGPALCVWRRGRGDECLLLLHGFASSSHIWSDWIARLPDCLHIIAIDLRGHGDSKWCSEGDYRFERHLGDIESVIEQLSLERIVLAGHSLGGNIAIVLAARLGLKVTRLLVIDAGPEMQVAPMRHARSEYRAMPRQFASSADYSAVLQLRHPMARPRLLTDLAKAELDGAEGQGFTLKGDPVLGQVLDIGHDDLLRCSLASIRARTLVMRGIASSMLSRAAAVEAVSLLPDGGLIEIDMAGHSIMLDNPEAFDLVATPFVIGGLRGTELSGLGANTQVPAAR